jgi:hypothetical protein
MPYARAVTRALMCSNVGFFQVADANMPGNPNLVWRPNVHKIVLLLPPESSTKMEYLVQMICKVQLL